MTAIKAPAEPKSFSVALSFEDGVTRFINCREDQTVADASYRQRINIPLDCRDGACGTCKARCESGTYDGGTYIDDALSVDEAAAGICVAVQHETAIRSGAADRQHLRHRQDPGRHLHRNRGRADPRCRPPPCGSRSRSPTAPNWRSCRGSTSTSRCRAPSRPGRIRSPTRRTSDRLTFLVKLTPGGAMSDYLDQRAAVGDTITFTGPHGSFFLREAERPVLMLAGGTGLAPDPGDAAHAARRRQPPQSAPDLRRQDRRRRGGARRTRPRSPRRYRVSRWEHCVSDPHTRAANQGRVMTLIRPDAPLRRRRRDLPVRAAGDGRVGAQPRHRHRHRTDRLLLREVRAGPRRPAPRDGRAPRPAPPPRSTTEDLLPATDARAVDRPGDVGGQAH